MAPILLLLIWAMVFLNGTKSLPHSSHPHRHHHHHYHHQYHHYYHQKHHHPAPSGDPCHTPIHDSVVYNCTELGLDASKCPSRAVGIPSVTQTPLGIPGFIYNRGVASNSTAEKASSSISGYHRASESAAKRSWINDAINKLQGCDAIGLGGETCPSKSLRVLAVGFLLFIVGVLLLCILVRLAFIGGSKLKQKVPGAPRGRVGQEVEHPIAGSSGQSRHLSIIAGPPHLEQRDPHSSRNIEIGLASAPRNGVVVDDKDSDRGRATEMLLAI